MVIPTFNRSELLRETVRSVLKQTEQDLELIIVSNGSTDDTAEVVAAFNDTRIRFVEQENSGSPASPRNHGIRLARGEFISFIDADDLWVEDRLAKLIAFLRGNPDKNWCFSHYDKLNGETGVITPHPIPETLAKGSYTPAEHLAGNFVGSPCLLIRRSLLERTGGYDESTELHCVEDWEFTLRLTADGIGGFLPEALAHYRQHPAAASASHDAALSATRCLACINSAVRKNPPVYAGHYDQAIAKVLPGMMRHLLVNGEGEKARAILKKAIRHPGKTPYLFLLRILSSLPSPLLTTLLSARRALGRTIGKR